jgi:hypothetical protein
MSRGPFILRGAQERAPQDDGIDMDARSRSASARRLAAAKRPSFAKSLPSKDRGRREDRVRAAPAVSCAMCTKKCAHEHTGSAESIRPSLRNGFTAYSVLSSVNGLSCHRRPCEAFASQELDTSIGVSEPHDFAVRLSAVRQWHIHVHRISTHVRDDRERPSCRVRRAERNH